MTNEKQLPTVKADYGQDMPGIIITAAIIGFIFALLAILFYYFTQHLIYTVAFGTLSIFLFTLSIAGIWSSRFGKIKLRNKVLSLLLFNGSENILDVGCGKGLLLIEAIKSAPNGHATGADIWDKTLEYNYSAQMVLQNAKIEGVENQITVTTADVQSLPFENNSFDMVMTSLMMHHVSNKELALKEMIRVTRPGGTLIIADVNAKRYKTMLSDHGMMYVEEHYATRLFMVPAYVISARKPEN